MAALERSRSSVAPVVVPPGEVHEVFGQGGQAEVAQAAAGRPGPPSTR